MGLTTPIFENISRHELDRKTNEWRAKGLSETEIKPLLARQIKIKREQDAIDARANVPFADCVLVATCIGVVILTIRKSLNSYRERDWNSTVQKIYDMRPRPQKVPTHGTVATGYAATASPAFTADYNEPLEDAAMFSNAMSMGGKFYDAARQMLEQITEQEEFISELTRKRFEARFKMKEALHQGLTQDEDLELERLKKRLDKAKIQFELATILAQIEALEAARGAAANIPPSQGGNGFSAHVTDAEIRRIASQIAAAVSKARAKGEDTDKVIKREAAALRHKYEPLVIKEILEYFQDHYGDS